MIPIFTKEMWQERSKFAWWQKFEDANQLILNQNSLSREQQQQKKQQIYWSRYDEFSRPAPGPNNREIQVFPSILIPVQRLNFMVFMK